MEGDCNVYAHSSLWMRPTRPDRYNAKMVYYSVFMSDFTHSAVWHDSQWGNSNDVNKQTESNNNKNMAGVHHN